MHDSRTGPLHSRMSSLRFFRFVGMVAVCWLAMAGKLAAQDYPSQPIHVIVPFAAGGGGDFVARAWSDKLSQLLGQPVLIENRPGGNTMVGTDYVAQASPDGYTLLVVNPNFVTDRLIADTPYDSTKDFAPVARFVTYPMGLAVRADLAVDDAAGLIAFAKGNPGVLNYGSSGSGSTAHLAALLLANATGVEMQHVPYNGAGPAIADLAAGTIDLFFTGLSQSVPHVESGRVKLLGVSSLNRIGSYPDLPSINEAVAKNFEALVWWGLVAPSGTPKERIATLQKALVQAMADPEVQKRYKVLDGDTTVTTSEDFTAFLATESDKWGRIIEAAGLSKAEP